MKRILILTAFIPLAVVAGNLPDEKAFINKMAAEVAAQGVCDMAWWSFGEVRLKLLPEERQTVLQCVWFESERNKTSQNMLSLRDWTERHPEYAAVPDTDLLSAWQDLRLKSAESGDKT